MVNNFDYMQLIISPQSEDDFWFGEIRCRKKDIPNLEKSTKLIKTYCIKDFPHLKEISSEIIKLCDLFHARFYLNPNVRSYKRINLTCAQKFLENIKNEQYYNPYRQINSVCGYTTTSNRDKIWVIDLDGETPSIERVQELLKLCSPNKGDDKIITILPTANGHHLLTKPFDKLKFSEYSINDRIILDDIKTNSPTLIYFNNDNNSN